MRRTATIVIEREGRDKGGVFTITEMASQQATEWGIRAMQVLARSGADVPPNIFQMGIQGFLAIGLGTVISGLGKAPWHEVKPLLDELSACITSYQPPGGAVAITQPTLIKSQIEEVATVLQMHEEVLALHVGFSIAAKRLSYRTLVANLIKEFTPTTETSIDTLASSSEAA